MNANENEMILTPAEVEQVEAALAEKPRVIPELLKLAEEQTDRG